MRLTISAFGRPAPQGSHDLGGAGQVLDSSPYLKSWRQQVRIATMRAYAAAGIRGDQLPLFPTGVPVVIERMTFYLLPEQCRALGTDEPIGKPDIDKLLRSTLDALGGAANPKHHARLFADDSQVIKIRELEKARIITAGKSGVFIIVSDGRD